MWKETNRDQRWDLDFGILHAYIVTFGVDYSAYTARGFLVRCKSLEDAQQLAELKLKAELEVIEKHIAKAKEYFQSK